MNLTTRFWLLSLALVSLLALAGCGGTGNTGGASGTNFTVNTLDSLKFEPAALTVKAGQEVVVEVKNTGALLHNWVLVKGDDSAVQKVATEGIAAGPAKSYIPDDQTNIIKASKLLNPGESEKLTFTAPAAGTYTFICTFPGHYPVMKGTLTVTN